MCSTITYSPGSKISVSWDKRQQIDFLLSSSCCLSSINTVSTQLPNWRTARVLSERAAPPALRHRPRLESQTSSVVHKPRFGHKRSSRLEAELQSDMHESVTPPRHPTRLLQGPVSGSTCTSSINPPRPGHRSEDRASQASPAPDHLTTNPTQQARPIPSPRTISPPPRTTAGHPRTAGPGSLASPLVGHTSWSTFPLAEVHWPLKTVTSLVKYTYTSR
ncbi:hypothetical protein E2C01_074488 [Portunus trituberculatus]|uniref:Uncharacterized protein n=1 Tax=Portunus trituberculatus TaxID=210409 RepID=A0A5B7I3G9_PORTR|nr:hypothetical protein [Portunus trituberculatus]